MLHNLLSTPDEVFITYDLDFVPATAAAAKDIKTAWPVWMDVRNGEVYPVFDVDKGTGKDGVYTYPDDEADPYKGGKKMNEWTVDKDAVMIGTAGHLHPGGLNTDLDVERRGDVDPATAHVFKSEAMYYEPAGAVSWDVAMTATASDWKVAVKKGDVLRTTTTYDSKRGSWYESMGIMVVWFTSPTDATGADPFTTKVDQRGKLTHGHLPENDNHGGEPDPTFVDLTTKPDGAVADLVTIADFAYAPGDMSGIYPDVPTVKQGGALKFVNKDAPIGVGIWHTITACKAPCDKRTGVAYPIADADIVFDSGELGFGGEPTAERDDWSIPQDLPPGTYTYFCRIHPSMRGGFRVTPS
jgi:plastocyanin